MSLIDATTSQPSGLNFVAALITKPVAAGEKGKNHVDRQNWQQPDIGNSFRANQQRDRRVLHG